MVRPWGVCLSACNQVLGSGDEPVRSLGSKWPPPSSSSHVSDDTWGSASDRRSAGHLGQLTINTGWNVPSASATPRHMQVCLLTRSACGSVESLMTVKKQTSKIDIVDKNWERQAMQMLGLQAARAVNFCTQHRCLTLSQFCVDYKIAT